MTKKLSEREIITEEVNFKVRQIMENKAYKCDVCSYWKNKRNSEMEYCLKHQKEFDELLKRGLEKELENVKE